MSNWRNDPASDGQLGLLGQLRGERIIPAEALSRLNNRLAARDFTKGEAHDSIDWIIEHCPKVQQQQSAQPAIRGGAISIDRPGVFESGDAIYVVKQNRAKTRMYAKRLVELRDAQGDRLTDAGGHVRFDFEYAPGAIYNLSEQDRMPESRAKDLHVRYGRCLNCGRTLKVAESLERGIGPVCAKSFRPNV